MTTKNISLFSKEFDEQLEQEVERLVKKYLSKYLKKFIEDYISRNFSKLMSEDYLLTSEEVMKILKISRQTLGRRIEDRMLIPINPESRRNYRFKKSDIDYYIERKELEND